MIDDRQETQKSPNDTGQTNGNTKNHLFSFEFTTEIKIDRILQIDAKHIQPK